jgi:thymidylate kinase
MVIVIAFEGCHGVGKTELMKKFANKYICLDESFIPIVKTKFNPQSFYLELNWAIGWFKRLENICSPFFNTENELFKKEGVIIADRSPYSSIIYSQNGELMKSSIDEIKKEFKQKGIYIIVIHVKDSVDNIWKRVQKRLKNEPWRKALNEDNKLWLEQIYAKYEKLNIWDKKMSLKNIEQQIQEYIKSF